MRWVHRCKEGLSARSTNIVLHAPSVLQFRAFTACDMITESPLWYKKVRTRKKQAHAMRLSRTRIPPMSMRCLWRTYITHVHYEPCRKTLIAYHHVCCSMSNRLGPWLWRSNSCCWTRMWHAFGTSGVHFDTCWTRISCRKLLTESRQARARDRSKNSGPALDISYTSMGWSYFLNPSRSWCHTEANDCSPLTNAINESPSINEMW